MVAGAKYARIKNDHLLTKNVLKVPAKCAALQATVLFGQCTALAAIRPNADIQLVLPRTTANDPLQTFAMTYFVRVVAILFVVPATYFFVFWVPFSLVHLGESHWLIAKIVSLLCALAAGWYVWARLAISRDNPVSSMLVGAFVIGSISFLAGFIGPIIFSPESNQGPLLGLFITGPLGFVAGLIVGLLWWRYRRSKNNAA